MLYIYGTGARAYIYVYRRIFVNILSQICTQKVYRNIATQDCSHVAIFGTFKTWIKIGLDCAG